MTELKLLDMPIARVFDDRPLLNRIVRALSLDQGVSYIDALTQLHDKVDDVYQTSSRGTLRDVLQRTPSDLGDIEDTVKVLARRDDAVNAAYDQAASQLALEQVDGYGNVLLDAAEPQHTDDPEAFERRAARMREAQQAALQRDRDPSNVSAVRVPLPGTTDIGRILADPQEFERRLARMRRAEPRSWDGPEGRAQFQKLDRAHVESGIDMVRTAERRHELAGARRASQKAAQSLDLAIHESSDKRQRLRLLDRQIAKLKDKRVLLDEPIEADNRVKMLNAASDLSERVPEQNQPLQAHADELYERTQERLRLLDRPQGDFLKTLKEIMDDVPLSEDAPAETAPPGVHPGSHELHRRIRERMRLLDRPDSAYVETLEEILGE